MEQADIRELATATWRLEKWLDNLNAERKMAAKSALRNIKKYISGCNVEVKDPLGSKFDPGLAVEVVNNESPETPDEELIIIEQRKSLLLLKTIKVRKRKILMAKVRMAKRKRRKNPRNKM